MIGERRREADAHISTEQSKNRGCMETMRGPTKEVNEVNEV